MNWFIQKIGVWLFEKAALAFFDFVEAYAKRKKQEKKDAENIKDYNDAKGGAVSREERAKRAEDLLNGN